MSSDEVAHYLSMINKEFEYSWPSEILETASKYYDVYSLACLEWEHDLSDSRLNKILADKELLSESTVRHVAQALYVTENPRFAEFTIAFCKNEYYTHIWFDLFELLSKVKNQQVEDFFIDYLVNDEKRRPDITKIVDGYFVQASEKGLGQL
jgi:regulatory protein YycH of two-component signal transduction system YycFG